MRGNLTHKIAHMALCPVRTLPPARGPATHLVVLVHGYGADGQDLIGLAQHWQGLLPTVAFAAPNAPDPHSRRPRLSMVSHLPHRPA